MAYYAPMNSAVRIPRNTPDQTTPVPAGMTPSGRVRAGKAPIGVFLAATVIIFFATLSAADSIGFVPYYIDGRPQAGGSTSSVASHDRALSDLPQLGENGSADSALAAAAAAAAKPKRTVYPVRISIPSVSINLPVQNPSTTDIDELDALLVSGPARYAESATLDKEGTVVIFAHSSHLPIVHNQMYRAFNSIPDAKAGDSITITGSDGTDYLYRVDCVVKASTNDGTKIPLAGSGEKLTLVTCDTLTGKSARYILTASFIGTD